MAYSYTRQSTISDGDTITAALFNNEYNQLLNAFAYSSSDASATGHRHDGSSAQGGSIFRIGDLDFLNKIEADSTNNRWGFYVQVSSSAVEQIRVQDGAIVPVTDNDIDLGTSSLEFKDAYFDGTVTTDALVADTADINGGSVDGATIGAASASTIVGTTITANTAFVPDASDGAALGSASLEFSDLFLADGAVINLGDDQDTTLTHVADTGILLNSTRQLQFGDSGTYIHQSADGVLDLVADTEIEINATTVDINGNVDISGTLTVAGAVDFGDAALSNVGAVQLDSIAGDEDSNTSITFSGSDVITIATGGTTALTIDASQNVTIAGDLTVTGDDITMGTNTAGNLLVADGTNFNSIAVGSLSEISTVASDDVLLAVDTSGGGLKKISRSTLVAGLATSGAISNVVEDTSPQLGGNLDTNSHNILVDDAHFIGDENGNEQIIFQTTSSAVNQFDITNAATGNPPKLSATGGDSNIDLDLEAKGTGHVTVRGNDNSGAIQFNCENNSHGQILKAQPHSAAVTNELLLPAGANSTLVSLVSTDTLTNKTINASNNTLSNIPMSATSFVAGTGVSLSTNTLSVDAAQTGITSLLATDIKIGEDDQTKIDFEDADKINFYAGNEKQLILEDGALYPGSDNIIDLGKSDNEFKDAFFDGTVTADAFAGPLTGDVTGNVSGTAATVTGAAQSNITSLGTLTTLTVDNVIINGTTIGHTDDTDLLTVADGVLTVAGEVSMTTLDIGGTNVTATAAELNYLDISTLGTTEASKVVTTDANGVPKFDAAITEKIVTASTSGTTLTIDVRDGSVFVITLGHNIGTLTLNNAVSSYASQFVLKLKQDGTGGRSFDWGSVKWAGGTAPTISDGANDIDVYILSTLDGSNWYGFNAGQDFS